MSDHPPMPHRLVALPVFRGLPVPWTVYVDDQGVPDFKVSVEERRIECAHDRLCGLCGVRLGYWIWFIGGELTVEHRLLFDPPMHEECARYAQAACPFISAADPRYSEATPRSEGAPDATTVVIPTAPVRRMYVMKTRGYEVAPPSARTGGTWAFRARPWAVVEAVRQ